MSDSPSKPTLSREAMQSDSSEWPRHPAFAHWLAGVMCIFYGFAKLSDAQFTILDSELSRPMGAVSGFWLTWYYFGYSPVYGNLIAGFQVVAGALLLLPKFRIVAALLLLPMALNIVAVDIFYGVGLSGLGSAIVLTICLLLILAPHWQRLWDATIPAADVAARRLYLIIPVILASAWGASYYIANVNNRLPTTIDGVWGVQPPDAGLAPSDSATELQLFFERNRAHMVVFRSPGRPDNTHHFELDSVGTVRIWRTWLERDSLMYTGEVGEDGRLLLRAATAPERVIFLSRAPRP
jgi:hypothetical protein